MIATESRAEILTREETLTREEAARFLKVAPQTLAVWACNRRKKEAKKKGPIGHTGPPYIAQGRAIRYRRSDLEEYQGRQTHRDEAQDRPTRATARTRNR